MSYCTKCGKPLPEGQACVCTATAGFCTQCGSALSPGLSCECMAKKAEEANESKESKESENVMEAEAPTVEPTINPEPVLAKQIIPGVDALTDEIQVKQYHIACLRNLFRINRAAGHLAITSKRIIFRAEKRSFGNKTIIQREHYIEDIRGIEAVCNYRVSATRILIGIMTLGVLAAIGAAGVLWFTYGSIWAEANAGHFVTQPPIHLIFSWAFMGLQEGWPHDIGYVSLGVGLIIGFGGVALFFLMRGRLWLKLAFLGLSVGGFGVAALAYNLYAFILLILSVFLAVFGLFVFSWVPDLVISVRRKEGVAMRLVYGRRLADVFKGRAGAGYAETAPTDKTADAIREIGAIIGDIRALGADGVAKWRVEP